MVQRRACVKVADASLLFSRLYLCLVFSRAGRLADSTTGTFGVKAFGLEQLHQFVAVVALHFNHPVFHGAAGTASGLELFAQLLQR